MFLVWYVVPPTPRHGVLLRSHMLHMTVNRRNFIVAAGTASVITQIDTAVEISESAIEAGSEAAESPIEADITSRVTDVRRREDDTVIVDYELVNESDFGGEAILTLTVQTDDGDVVVEGWERINIARSGEEYDLTAPVENTDISLPLDPTRYSLTVDVV